MHVEGPGYLPTSTGCCGIEFDIFLESVRISGYYSAVTRADRSLGRDSCAGSFSASIEFAR